MKKTITNPQIQKMQRLLKLKKFEKEMITKNMSRIEYVQHLNSLKNDRN